jgi:hypothetical protein
MLALSQATRPNQAMQRTEDRPAVLMPNFESMRTSTLTRAVADLVSRWADQMNTPFMDTCCIRVHPLTALERYERSGRYDEIYTTAPLEPSSRAPRWLILRRPPLGWFQTEPLRP